MTGNLDYNAQDVARYFDELGRGEWDRLETSLIGRISFRIHRKFLLAQISPGMRVLDAGCGPGRFAIEMLRAGARVTLVDISTTQLDLARENISDAQLLDRVDGLHQLDVCDLSDLEGRFDAVMCYGGALSYARERHRTATAELARAAKPGAAVLVSVMSLYGVLRLVGALDAEPFLTDMDVHLKREDFLDGKGYALTQSEAGEFHLPIALFSSKYLAATITNSGCQVMNVAAANPLTMSGLALERISADASASRRLLDLELSLCDRPEYVDVGEHLIIVARKK